jgi:hypothetical protein
MYTKIKESEKEDKLLPNQNLCTELSENKNDSSNCASSESSFIKPKNPCSYDEGVKRIDKIIKSIEREKVCCRCGKKVKKIKCEECFDKAIIHIKENIRNDLKKVLDETKLKMLDKCKPNLELDISYGEGYTVKDLIEDFDYIIHRRLKIE